MSCNFSTFLRSFENKPLNITGYEIGCVSEERYRELLKVQKELDIGLNILDSVVKSRYKWRQGLGKETYADSSGNAR